MNLDHYDRKEIERLLRDEGWDHPPAEVRRILPSGWYRAAFWALRAYIIVMVVVVAIGFARGAH